MILVPVVILALTLMLAVERRLSMQAFQDGCRCQRNGTWFSRGASGDVAALVAADAFGFVRV